MVVPEDSRTSVQNHTWEGLTAGFGKGPGVTLLLWPLILPKPRSGFEPECS